MTPSHPNRPAMRSETNDPRPERAAVSSGEITTTGGVKVVVNERRRPPATPTSGPLERAPRVVIRVPDPQRRERDAYVSKLFEQHGEWIKKTLVTRGDVLEESANDLRQDVLVILTKLLDSGQRPDNVRGYLIRVIRNVVSNHKREWRPDVDREADADLAVGSTPDAEGLMRLVQQWEKLERYIACLPQKQQQVIRCVDFEGMSLEETADALGRPCGTVASQLARAKEMLEELALASERAEAERRR